jgi:hypothetical protein
MLCNVNKFRMVNSHSMEAKLAFTASGRLEIEVSPLSNIKHALKKRMTPALGRSTDRSGSLLDLGCLE